MSSGHQTLLCEVGCHTGRNIVGNSDQSPVSPWVKGIEFQGDENYIWLSVWRLELGVRCQ